MREACGRWCWSLGMGWWSWGPQRHGVVFGILGPAWEAVGGDEVEGSCRDGVREAVWVGEGLGSDVVGGSWRGLGVMVLGGHARDGVWEVVGGDAVGGVLPGTGPGRGLGVMLLGGPGGGWG